MIYRMRMAEREMQRLLWRSWLSEADSLSLEVRKERRNVGKLFCFEDFVDKRLAFRAISVGLLTDATWKSVDSLV